MTATTRREDRAVGLVWQNAIEVPAAHVLIIGVSHYQSGSVPFVASPARSARAVADWFLGEEEGCFKNARTPLGSLAILLSEADDGTESTVLGAFVPRATFQNVQKAVSAWRSRAEAGERAEENMLVLFVVSHGESFGRRTAFLLEDYDTLPDQIRFGMSEVEQLVDAVANLTPKAQLLVFDCCRLPTLLRLGFDKELGMPLLDPPGRPDARQPMVLRSTALGHAAYGEDAGLTVFTEALLEAARGLAATPADKWVIGSSSLAETVTRLVGLRRKDGEPLQRPGSALSEWFPISKVEPAATTTAFIWLSSDHAFANMNFVERIADGDKIRAIPRANDGNEFLRLTLTDPAPRRIDARDAADVSIGEVELTPYPPVIFQELPDRMSIAQPRPRNLDPAHDFDRAGPRVAIVFSVRQQNAAPLAHGTVAKLTATANVAEPIVSKSIVAILPTGGHETTIELPAGDYTLVVTSSSGTVQTRRFTAKPDTETRIDLELPSSSDEFMAQAISAGVVAADAVRDTRVPPDALETHDKQRTGSPADGGWIAGGATFAPVVDQSVAQVKLVSALGNPKNPLVDWSAGGEEASHVAALVGLHAGPTNQRYGLLTVDDRRTRPFRRKAEKGRDRPLWLAVAGPGWREVAWCPTMGRAGRWMRDENDDVDPWRVEFVIDTMPESGRSHAAAVVQSRQWTALLAFLARRDFVNGGAIIETMLESLLWSIGGKVDNPLAAIAGKIDNPLAAIAGALMAIGAGRLDEAKIPLGWLENLANQFPNVPDGPVLLARQRRLRGEATDTRHHRALLLEAARRGVPGFSLALDWLNEELALYATHSDCAEAAKRFRRLALMADPSRTFTVLRVG
ncbi:MAG: caspase family protein [Mesorhizobium sp.]|uniref:caspase family protein n=1 Tax=Mesorhizobium sp. TaxID=1871066 RepID=UPI000FE37F69|nr:caspase family protein [Mesorhizobium sp.]RWO10982.1 MAG: caspase family protein [Mesorhizobium sp.]RWQ22707.1 MAG: caspase family protein [Mesorhizobium sp.]RWQ55238.1 MAG: caspase family protein [Mesorhizobium sp.]